MRHIEGKPDIVYPCQWEFRIIGENETRLAEIVGEIAHKPYTLTQKNHSSNGRFVSMHLSLQVADEQERNAIYSQLSHHPEIKMVL